MTSLSPLRAPLHWLALTTALMALGGCSTLDNFFQGDKLDYRSKSERTNTLEVPPDLTQLSREGRYTPQSQGTVSASSFQTSTSTAATASSAAVIAGIAPVTAGDFKLMRNGNQRWLLTPVAAEKLWPQLRAFWQERGFTITTDAAEAGLLETNWAENRAKIDDGIFRRTIGRALNTLYSTGERDKYRMRIERNTSSNGTEIYVTHYGMQEVFTSELKDRTSWTARPNDPQLEAEMLQRMMVKLGAKPDEAVVVVAAATPTSSAARARVLTGQAGANLQVDENFDRAWRRVGLALDRNGFTVEDRDRSTGTYYVRYADPRNVGKDDPGFFSRLFGASADANAPNRYRVNVKADGERSTVAVQNAQGAAESGEVGTRIVNLLLEDLR